MAVEWSLLRSLEVVPEPASQLLAARVAGCSWRGVGAILT